ncbi:MAG: putative PEP-binding protein, partial [Candidatus Thermoplasmatota archaeon]|nr:putative PEP-binding protein [Candidatus Thermoplasmatota archaeon]
GMCCIVGAGELEIDAPTRRFTVGDHTIMEGDLVTLNGTAGKVYAGELPLRKTVISSEYLSRFLSRCDRHRKLKVRTNADTPADAQRALEFGAEGIGLFRIEHMFYGDGSEEPLFYLRKMIMAGSHEERKAALNELYPHMRDDIRETLRAMEGLPVTIRLMDPPLHEFIPHEPKGQAQLAQALDIDGTELTRRAEQLRETNPMMGHRGVRLGVTYPDITELQAKAILTATAELQAEGITVLPEIMVPLTAAEAEFTHQEHLVRRVAGDVEAAQNCKLDYLVGTMIEIPRATLMAGKIAETAEFFSYGTNDLTQMTFGFSRDDSGGFLPEYVKQGILSADPFATLDTGVGELVTIGIERGRATRPDLKVGICGEHGGDPVSVAFCHAAGMDYVSCSPFRVPIARLAAAQAVLNG